MKIIQWKTLSSEVMLKANIFRYLKVRRESPTTLAASDFDVIQCLNWVNVIAITPDQKIVLIKQYRHGTDEVTIEIPGGAVHQGEDVLLAAQRELREETGFTAGKWVHIGRLDANPAFMTNYCDTYLALDATKTDEQEFDPFEEISVHLEEVKNLEEKVRTGEITHSLIVAAFYLYRNYRP